MIGRFFLSFFIIYFPLYLFSTIALPESFYNINTELSILCLSIAGASVSAALAFSESRKQQQKAQNEADEIFIKWSKPDE